MTRVQFASGACTLSLLLLMGCQSRLLPGLPPVFELDSTPAVLAEPAVFDWSTQRVSGPGLAKRRAAHARTLLAFGNTAGWAAAGESVQQWTGSTSDYVCNGTASVYTTAGTPTAVANCHFLLTQAGKLIRVKADKSAYSTLDLGRTFSRTYVTLSPAGGRAYLLSDDGRFFVVNTAATPMTYASYTLGVTGNAGISVSLDPFRSNIQDAEDEVYVPTADGKVRKYVVTRGATALAVPSVSAPTVYTVSANAFKAPGIVLDGDIYIGDQAGQFVRYDTDTSSAVSTFLMGANAKFNAAPSIAFDASGNPAHVFATVGSSCAWMNLTAGTVTFSRGLFLDDGEAVGTTSGYLHNYDYTNSPATYTLSAAHSLTINAGGQNLETTPAPASYKYANELIAAQTYNNNPDQFGPVVGYVRWDNTAWTLPADKVIQKVVLGLFANGNNGNTHWCPPPEMHSTSPYLKGGPATLWTFANMTSANAPNRGAGNNGTYQGNMVQGNAKFQKNKDADFDVTPAFGSAPADHFALALEYDNTTPYEVFWPYGGASAAGALTNGGPADANKEAVHFETHANANPPELTFYVTSAAMPTPSIETPPIIDAWNNRVYVFYTNAVYSLSYASEAAWADTEYDATNNPTGTMYSWWALTTSGDRNRAGARGATFNGKSLFVGNMTAPLLSWDGSSLVTLDRYPTALSGQSPTIYRYALTKFAVNAGLPTVANTHEFASQQAGKEASSYLILNASGANVLFGLPNATGNAGLYHSFTL